MGVEFVHLVLGVLGFRVCQWHIKRAHLGLTAFSLGSSVASPPGDPGRGDNDDADRVKASTGCDELICRVCEPRVQGFGL